MIYLCFMAYATVALVLWKHFEDAEASSACQCNSWQYPESSERSSPDSVTLKDDSVIRQVSQGVLYPLGLEQSVANEPAPLLLTRRQESEIILLVPASPLNVANGRPTLLSSHA